MGKGSSYCGGASQRQLRNGNSRKSTPLKISQNFSFVTSVTYPTFCTKLFTQIFKALRQKHK